MSHLDTNGPDRLVVLPSADHDFSRLACGNRTIEQLPAAFTFLLTWGSVPSIYFGDEIGMRYLEGIPEKEGSIWTPKYNRAGCRTPMQWDNALANAGFSTAPPEDLYLPQDPDADRPTVAAQMEDPDSLLHFVRRLVHLRKSTAAVGTETPTRLLAVGYPPVYVRNGTHVVVINPLRRAAEVEVEFPGVSAARYLIGHGVRIEAGTVYADGFGCGVFELPG